MHTHTHTHTHARARARVRACMYVCIHFNIKVFFSLLWLRSGSALSALLSFYRIT